MTPRTPPVGADCESICGKCGDVWHVVVAKVGDRIARVQCKQCSALHRYSPPQAVRDREKQAKTQARAAVREGRPAPNPRASTRAYAPLVPIDPLRTARAYRPSETYEVGDVLEHATFGRGVVEVVLPPSKIQVFFADERRVLVAGRTETKLVRARPAPTDEGSGG